MVFQPNDESRVVFLAVHPSAWKSTPPTFGEIPARSNSTAQIQPPPERPSFQIQAGRTFTATFGFGSRSSRSTVHSSSGAGSLRRTTGRDPPQTLAYVHYIHSSALRALTKTTLLQITSSTDVQNAREWSKVIVESYGHQWPEVLDQDFPGTLSNEGEGVLYQTKFIKYTSFHPSSSTVNLII
jgi:hypothetical protein